MSDTSSRAHESRTHPSDGELLALYDAGHSGSVEARREVDSTLTHVADCRSCAARVQALGDASFAVRDALALVDPPHRDVTIAIRRALVVREHKRDVRWSKRPVLFAIAAGIAFAVVASAGTVHWLRKRALTQTGAGAPSAVAGATTSANAKDFPTVVSFAPSDSLLTIRFDVAPAGGLVTIDRAAGDQASVRVPGAPNVVADPVLVLPDELRVQNQLASRASYALSIPPRVVRVRVIVAGRMIYEGPGDINVPLAR